MNVNSPLVTVICLCFNQKKFVREAVESVVNQTYKNIQMVLVDDASTDGSDEEIKKLKLEYPSIEAVMLETNIGNCKAFNKGFTLAKGDFVIDLAADDVLMPTRVEVGVSALQGKGSEYDVNFSDAALVDESGRFLSYHSDKYPHHTIPQGNVYKEIISRYFICPPTVMGTREVLEYLSGYDESLSYEDFDFWIRSSRKFMYCYSPAVLVKKRLVSSAMSKRQGKLFTQDSDTTFRVCEKIMGLNQSTEEQKALSKRIRYEVLLNLRLLNLRTVFRYLLLWKRNRSKRYQN